MVEKAFIDLILIQLQLLNTYLIRMLPFRVSEQIDSFIIGCRKPLEE